MDFIINSSMVICFVLSLFFSIANLTGGFIYKVLARLVGIIGMLLPLCYLLIKLGFV